jgi:glycerol-3-phosphate dehydrogenase
MQVVKQRENGRVIGTETRVVHGDWQFTPALLGEHTAYVERTNLTTRHMNGRLVRKTLGYSKQRDMLYAACVWEDVVYNFARHVKTLRLEVNEDGRRWLQRSPAMAAEITDHVCTIEELLTLIPIFTNT